MKFNYLIWLDSGQCIEGIAEEKEVDRLIGSWELFGRGEGNVVHTIKDDDGELSICPSSIRAISKNAIVDGKTVGY